MHVRSGPAYPKKQGQGSMVSEIWYSCLHVHLLRASSTKWHHHLLRLAACFVTWLCPVLLLRWLVMASVRLNS